MVDIIVTTLEDEAAETDPNTGAFTGNLSTEAADGGGLSLREAVQLAQNGDRIVFADDLNGVMRIDGSLQAIGVTTNISIYGDDRITISGDVDQNDVIADGLTNAAATMAAGAFTDNSKILFLANSAANVLFDGLTLTGGRDASGFGGAVDAFNSRLTVQGSTFAGNISYNGYGGGAIYTGADLTVEDSAFFDNIAIEGTNTAVGHGGGAIFSTGGNLGVINTTFAENQALNGTVGTAASGGAIFADGDVYLNNVTITGNQAQFQGGGLFATNGPLVEQEPGVFVAEDDVAIFNSIIVGNNAGAIGPGANDELDGYDLSAFTIENSITSNADGPPSGVFAETKSIGVTNSASTFTAGVLADNGGPVQTVALLFDPLNPAIGAGGLNARLGDARGIDSFGQRDLGAYEQVDNANLIVTSLDDGIDATDGVITLREAVLAANARAGRDDITFADNLSGVIRLSEGVLEITETLFLQGEGRITLSGDTAGDDTTIDDVTDLASSTAQALENNTRIFDVTATSGFFAMAGLTLTGGRAEGEGSYANVVRHGGAIRVLEENIDLYIGGSTFAGNVAAGSGARGGGIFSNGDIAIYESEFVGNLADNAGGSSRGGAVASAADAKITINSSFFGDNSAGSVGGAVAGGIVTATNSTFTGNSLASDFVGRGGAIFWN